MHRILENVRVERLFGRVVAFLGSLGLAAVLLVLLLVLTLLGTLEQGHRTLYDVQTDYFQSFLVIHYVAGRYPVPFPGGYLLLSLLFANLLVGGVLRVRKGASNLGALVVHVGIVFLLVGSFVEDRLSTKGALYVWEPAGDGQETAEEFASYQDWEVAVVRPDRDGGSAEFVIPHDEFADLGPEDRLRCRSADLPFDVVLSGYLRNSKLARAGSEAAGDAVDGLVLVDLPPVSAKARAGNVAGLRATLVEKASGTTHRALLWGNPDRPASALEIGAQPWSVVLRKRTWPLPFAVRLDRFVHETHPGTGMPRRYSSYVTVIEEKDGRKAERQVHVTMNEPLRYEGYTLYQSDWGPEMGAPGRRLYSGFSVVANPSDRVPLIACVVIAIGLLLHFLRKLVRHLEAEAGSAAAHGRTN